MTREEAIKWLYKHSDIEPHEGSLEGSQTSYWHCRGCNGEFISRWPKWEKPTFENFPHDKDCEYLQVLKLLDITPSPKESNN